MADHPPVVAWLALSREYLEASHQLNRASDRNETIARRPLFQLLGIALELVLKADLLMDGTSETDLKDAYGHRLTKLYAAANGARKKAAEAAAKKNYIKYMRQLRDDYANSFGSEWRSSIDLPSNSDIGESVPPVQSLIDQLGSLYATNDSLRYFQEGLFQFSQVQVPPWSDHAALYLYFFSKHFAEQTEQAFRDFQQTVKAEVGPK